MGPVRYEKLPILFDFDFASVAAEREYKKLPVDAQTAFGHDFHELQIGREAESSKVLSHFGSAKVRELIFEDETGTYRAVYTVEFPDVIYELHAFKKKSRSGISTDKQDLDKVAARLRDAEARYKARLQAQQGGKP
jgi:phage-related protein